MVLPRRYSPTLLSSSLLRLRLSAAGGASPARRVDFRHRNSFPESVVATCRNGPTSSLDQQNTVCVVQSQSIRRGRCCDRASIKATITEVTLSESGLTTKNVPGRTATLVEFEHGSEPPMLRRLRERLLALSCGTCLDCKAIVGHNWHNCERCRRNLWVSR
jgi:hypothetical protein